MLTSLTDLSPSPELGRSLPPSLRLVPSRSYTGRPIGTTYTVAVFPAPGAEEVKVETDLVLPVVSSASKSSIRILSESL